MNIVYFTINKGTSLGVMVSKLNKQTCMNEF